MSTRAAVIIGALWLTSLVAVAATARDQTIEVIPGKSRILSGGEIGFRLDGMQGNVPAGTLVILWNGRWVEPTATKKPILITR
jgi:sensor domain CHASE-containing protein